MPKTVLIVDDHSDTRIICRELLSHYGYATHEAQNGVEALQLADEHGADLILLDFLMPERDGLQVLGDLRSRASLAATPILLYTAAASRLDEFSLNPQVTRVVLKPMEAARLMKIIMDLIGPPEPLVSEPA